MSVIAEHCPEIKVTVVDINEDKINSWNNKDCSKLPVYEKGLDLLIKKNRNKNLFFTTDIKKSISEADIIFISVNTPTKQRGLGAGYASDLKWIESSARMVSDFACGHTIVVEKSTVPVRTAELIQKILTKSIDNDSNKTFSVLSSPEFLAEGTAIKDLENPDRVLIGGEDLSAMEQLSFLYQKWIPKEKIFVTNLWSSELSKLTANAFLAQRISSINAISSLCEPTGADIKEVAKAIGADKRIGEKFLNAGPGFGGSCFQKDLLNIIYLCRYYGLEEVANYWEQVVLLNEWQKKRISKLIIESFFGTVASKKLVILGFAFKSNTNDTRESPAIAISKELIENGANLYIHDPQVSEVQLNEIFNEKNFISNRDNCEGSWTYTNDLDIAFRNADAIIIITEWSEYLNINWSKISKIMRQPSWVFDTRGIIEESDLLGTNINFWKLGKGFLESS
jgi:UDPglucose 6-dehydrogenase